MYIQCIFCMTLLHTLLGSVFRRYSECAHTVRPHNCVLCDHAHVGRHGRVLCLAHTQTHTLAFGPLQHQDHGVLLPGAVHLLPRPGVRLVREPGPVPALERPQAAGRPGTTLRLLGHGELKGSPRALGPGLDSSQEVRDGRAILFYWGPHELVWIIRK